MIVGQRRQNSRMSSRSSTTSGSTISTDELHKIVDNLKSQRFKNSTKRNYYSVWTTFNQFFVKLDHRPDTWEERLTLFIGYLIEQNKKSQTLRSYISAIKAILSEVNFKLNEDKFLLSALTRACKYKNDRVTMRLPIRKGMLKIVMEHTYDYFAAQLYLCSLYLALFSTAYFGLFRVGELTSGSHPVLVGNVHIARNKRKFLFILETSKTHGLESKPQSVKVTSTVLSTVEVNPARSLQFCPYKLLREYSGIRPKYLSRTEPFFVFSDGSPVRPHQMRSVLKQMIQLAGFDPLVYNCQSLCIGRASDLLKMGVSVESIKQVECWTSNTVFTYLRNL